MGGLSSLALLPLLKQQEPDLVLYNGNIWTVDPSQPRAQAVAISGGRFVAVGSNDEVLHLAAARTRKSTSAGKPSCPGSTMRTRTQLKAACNFCDNVACDKDSIEEIQAALHRTVPANAARQWVLGFLYDDGKTPRPINRHDLDVAVPDHPVMVRIAAGTSFL